MSKDIDAKIGARVLLDPKELQVAWRGPDGHAQLLYVDTQCNDSFALLHQRAYDDALSLEFEGVDARRLRVKLLAPLDRAVSKLSRFSEQTRFVVAPKKRFPTMSAILTGSERRYFSPAD